MSGPALQVAPVTVVIPAFNAATYLDRALASVQAQTVPPAEIIVVDDASTDNTAAIAAGWQDRLPLRIIRCEVNGGIGVARRVAIEAATQPYIANLDADDEWLDHHLATVVPLLGDSTIVATRCLHRRLDGSGGESVERRTVPVPELQEAEIFRANFLFSGSVYPAAPLLDPAIGASELRRAEDWDTWIRLIVLGGCRATPVSDATVVKYSHTASMSAGADYIDADLEIYRRLAADERFGPWHAELPRYMARREARASMIAAARLAEAGDTLAARRLFLSAALVDRSLAGWLQAAGAGSVLLRSLVGVVSPKGFLWWRARRAERQGLVTGGG
jgi:glycosyltransferase involved in cell wall biosynthesis